MVNYTKNKKQRGYALLFAIVVTSIISVIVAGLSNLTYKQLILTSLVKDSQTAFYMADTATECALYADMILIGDGTGIISSPWNCGLDNNNNPFSLTKVNGVDGSYDLNHATDLEDSPQSCFEISVKKTPLTGATQVKSRGYNMCNTSNIRTVQREIEVNY